MNYILLLCYVLSVFGTSNVIYKHQLRGLFDKEKNKLTNTYTDMEYENIYSNIIQNAILGKTEIKFTILCWNEHNTHNKHHHLIKNVLDDCKKYRAISNIKRKY
jgi:hypothetical protein